jgi:UDP-2-acetamido-3-amino-2,3-dideoxy-glucuronate N-acetyltransferase
MVSEDSPPKVAVIGTGYWGRNLVRDFHALGALGAVCDSDPAALAAVAAAHPGVKAASSLEQVLADPGIRGVAVATPAPSHARLAQAVLTAGKDALVEKPLTVTLDEGRAVVDLARRLGRVLMVDHLLNRHRAVVKLKELIGSGELGRVVHVQARRLNLGRVRHEENALWSLAPHDLGVIMTILGEAPLSVQAFGGSWLTPGVCDQAHAHLVFPAGLTASIEVSWLSPLKEQRLAVVGLEKMAVFDDTAPWESKLVLYPHRLRWRGLEAEAVKAEGIPVPLDRELPLRSQCLAFLEAMESRIPPPDSDGLAALRVLSILSALDRSMAEARPQVPRIPGEDQGYFVHPTALVDPGAVVGEGARIWHFSHVLEGSVVGPGANVGQNVVIGPRAKVGRGCRIQNNVSVYEGVELGEDVFCGPSMVFTNVHNPRAFIRRMGELRPTRVRRGATIGANATIVCGHELGEYCFIGAGAVVATDVPAHALMAGVPARRLGWVCRCGVRLPGTLVCPECGLAWREGGPGLVPA